MLLTTRIVNNRLRSIAAYVRKEFPSVSVYSTIDDITGDEPVPYIILGDCVAIVPTWTTVRVGGQPTSTLHNHVHPFPYEPGTDKPVFKSAETVTAVHRAIDLIIAQSFAEIARARRSRHQSR